MLKTKEQKIILAAVVVMIVALSAVSLWRKNVPEPVADGKKQKEEYNYNAYLAAVEADPVASQSLFEQLISKDEIEKEVKDALKTSQKFSPSALDEKKIQISQTSSKQKAQEYLLQIGRLADDFNAQMEQVSLNLFGQGASFSEIDAAVEKSAKFKEQLYTVIPPKDALDFHKSALIVYSTYEDLLSLARSYNLDSSQNPWPQVYKDYWVINESMADINSQMTALDGKYKLASLPVSQSNVANAVSFFGVPKAHAIFVPGGTEFIIGDIPRAIEQSIRDGLASAFANFATKFLNNLINSLEQNYRIANFLYYTDALVSGQYADDYLNKYISNSVDRAMIKNFIPQFNCGQSVDLKEALKVKADSYLGFNPESLSPSDPDYYKKMTQMGSFLSSPQGWLLYYQDIAAQARSEAEKAADREITSPGLKSPREAIGSQIAASLSSITSSMQAVFNAQLNLGVVNVDKVIGQIVSSVTYNLFNKFVFRGAVVYKEQSACLQAPQIQLVIPAAFSSYSTPSSTPNADSIIQEQCERYPRGCTQLP